MGFPAVENITENETDNRTEKIIIEHKIESKR